MHIWFAQRGFLCIIFPKYQLASSLATSCNPGYWEYLYILFRTDLVWSKNTIGYILNQRFLFNTFCICSEPFLHVNKTYIICSKQQNKKSNSTLIIFQGKSLRIQFFNNDLATFSYSNLFQSLIDL